MNVAELDDVKNLGRMDLPATANFRLSYYPHRLKNFTEMLDQAFPDSNHIVLSDWTEHVQNPGFYVHIIRKQ